MCLALKCSRSGYYDWITLGRPQYKAFDSSMNQLVLELYYKDTRWGITQILMNLKKIHGLISTKSTVYRYMRLNQIQSIIRRKRKRYGTVQHHKIPNLLQRDFTTSRPNEKWSIDVSYLHVINRTIYLCAIKDLYDKSIVSYLISRFNNNTLVFETLKEAFRRTPSKHRKGLIIHSDQGSQFTSPIYARLLDENGVTHSVSAKGSCVDNCPIESWFSALKTESIYLHKQLDEKSMIALVDQYVKYYNEERLQEKLKALTPYEYRTLTLNCSF